MLEEEQDYINTQLANELEYEALCDKAKVAKWQRKLMQLGSEIQALRCGRSAALSAQLAGEVGRGSDGGCSAAHQDERVIKMLC